MSPVFLLPLNIQAYTKSADNKNNPRIIDSPNPTEKLGLNILVERPDTNAD